MTRNNRAPLVAVFRKSICTGSIYKIYDIRSYIIANMTQDVIDRKKTAE